MRARAVYAILRDIMPGVGIELAEIFTRSPACPQTLRRLVRSAGGPSHLEGDSSRAAQLGAIVGVVETPLVAPRHRARQDGTSRTAAQRTRRVNFLLRILRSDGNALIGRPPASRIGVKHRPTRQNFQ